MLFKLVLILLDGIFSVQHRILYLNKLLDLLILKNQRMKTKKKFLELNCFYFWPYVADHYNIKIDVILIILKIDIF